MNRRFVMVAVGLMAVFGACSGVAGDGRFDFEEDSGSGLSPNMAYEFAFVEIDGLFFELQIVDTKENVLVYSERNTYRKRDRNLAAWVDDSGLFTYSGDIGDLYVTRKDDGTWSLEALRDSATQEILPGFCIPGSLAEQTSIEGYVVCP